MTETVYTIRGNLGALRSSTTLTNRSTDVAPGFCTRPEGQRISILGLWIPERTKVGLASARARGRMGGGQYKMTRTKLRLAMAAMGQRQTVVSELCKELRSWASLARRSTGISGQMARYARMGKSFWSANMWLPKPRPVNLKVKAILGGVYWQ